ncbi:MAG: zinc ribbon domain-containing protein [Deltaproteobacteria bacterium]|jgi:putative FmdB family regulatory protein|nr:zinc ribbon domain-containing protein [Deltaproteobacteria bacterium]
MPIYEYECASCGKITEAAQRMSDPPLTVCPECQGELRKIMSRTSFQLKGSGWYTTDYKKTDGGTGPDPTLPGPKPKVPLNGDGTGEGKPKRKSYLDQTPSERKSTVKEIVNKVANKI